MIASLILASLLASAAQEATPLEGGRFRLTVTVYDSSASGQADALVGLTKAAVKVCKAKGLQAVSEGTLEVNQAPPNARGRKGLAISEVYRCVPKAK